MQTQLTSAVKKAPGAPFVRVKPGVFGLLRYPEGAPEPEAPPAAPAAEEKHGEEAGESRSRRRRRGGRGRHRDRRGGEETPSTETSPKASSPAVVDSEPREIGAVDTATDTDDDAEGAEEPNIGSMSAEARAAALAETGVLEGGNEDDEAGDDEAGEVDETSGESTVGADGPDDAGSGSVDDDDDDADADADDDDDVGEEDDEQVGADNGAVIETADGSDEAAAGEETPAPIADAQAAVIESTTPTPTTEPSTPSPTSQESIAHPSASPSSDQSGQGGRKVMSPVDAAIEILKGQSPGRGVHVRQIADSAVRRRLVHGEPNEAWRVLRAALASESKERLRAGVRPRIKSAGSGLYALSRRVPDADLEKAEYVFGEARRALRERTLAALEQRLGELAPSSFEALARVLLQREGFGPATFVKRVEGTIYVEALRGRGFRPSRCLIALRPGMTAAGRRALGELRAGVRARNQDEGVLLLAGRLGDDAIAEWKQPGQPVEIVDGPALAETCVRHGIGVISANVSVDLVDADFFAELSEG